MSIYFNIIGIRKYVIKKVVYNIGNTITCSGRLQQTTFSDAFFLGPLRVKMVLYRCRQLVNSVFCS